MRCSRFFGSLLCALPPILLGTAASAATFYPTSDSPIEMAVVDLNHDGRPDVVVTGSSLSVLLNHGDGTFGPHVDYSGANGDHIAVADFNGDGNPDVVTEGAGIVSVSLGKGDGTLQPAISTQNQCGIDTADLAVGDFDGDGKSDLVISHDGPRKLAVLLGDGKGSFRLGSCRVAPIDELTAVDINSDGKLDIVGTNFDLQTSPYALLSLLGNGDGTFQSPLLFDKNDQLKSPLFVDVNHDGLLDIVALGNKVSPYAVKTFLGNGDGSFRKPSMFVWRSALWDLTGGLLDGDGNPDLMVEAEVNSKLSVTFFAGQGNGRYLKGTSIQVPALVTGMTSLDLDGDGKGDVVGLVPLDNEIMVLRGNGDGTFQ